MNIYFDQPDAKDIELLALRKENEELRECVTNQLSVIKNLISGNKIVNIDEAIAYYEKQLLKK